MRKIIILSAATLVLSSCGIYNKYKPVSEVPEGLYASQWSPIRQTSATSRGGRFLPTRLCKT